MISLCVIVDVASAELERLVRTTSPFVAETVIVIANDVKNRVVVEEMTSCFGARCVYHPFTDFADSREFALQQATNDWVLVLDPDEEVESDHLQQLARLSRCTGALGYRVPRYDYIGCNGWALSRPCRFFRRYPTPRYVGPVYEEPGWPESTGGEVRTAWGLAIHHAGFLQSERHLLSKRIRYSMLSETRPMGNDTVWRWRIKAMLAADSGDWNRALACAEIALRLASHVEIPSMSLILARLWLALGYPERGLDLLQKAESSLLWENYQRSRLANVRGLLFFRLRDFNKALESFCAAGKYNHPVASYLFNLAVTYRELGQIDLARIAFSRAKVLNSRCGQYHRSDLQYQDTWVHRLDTLSGKGAFDLITEHAFHL